MTRRGIRGIQVGRGAAGATVAARQSNPPLEAGSRDSSCSTSCLRFASMARSECRPSSRSAV